MPIPPAPVVYPTVDEWRRDPCEYIEKLHHKLGKKHGIVKIVIPTEARPDYHVWKEFATKFVAKRQPLNLIDGLARQDAFFELQCRIEKFKNGKPLPRDRPAIGGRRVRLFELKRALDKHGSLDLLLQSDIDRVIGPGTDDRGLVMNELECIISGFLTSGSCDGNVLLMAGESEISAGEANLLDPPVGAIFWKGFKDSITLQVKVIEKGKSRTRLLLMEYNTEEAIETEDLAILFVSFL